MNNKFDDIRPYYDSEAVEALQRITQHPLFEVIASYVYPELSLQEVRQKVESVGNIYDFQHQIMHRVNRQIIKNSITEMTYGGVEKIDPQCGYLFVSNHRDIMLDASLMQNILMDHNIPTAQITFGANLMRGELVIDIGKSNKMFRVERPGGNIRDFYRASSHLSEYIREVIVEGGESVWIAQRNGRTKDGIDRTDQGIINMFRLSCSKDKIRSIAELNLLPVAVSYEWEPCDIRKATELYARRRGPYIKQADEDLQSILTGITQYKGRVHFEFCEPLTQSDVAPYAELSSNELNKAIATLVDGRICRAYHLFPNNYIAHDMLSGTNEYAAEYSAEERERFIAHLEKCEQGVAEDIDKGEIREIMLGIYAYAVDSKREFSL